MGYRALILSGAYESFAMALDNVQVCAIPKDTFNTIVQRNPAFNHKLLAVMATELNMLEYQMTNLVQRPVIQRLAELLLTWKQVYGTIADGRTIALQITRIELAKVLGTTPETVSRSLSHLQHDGLITIHGKAIGIDDTGRLVDLTLLHD
jgi:CRP-like cAMP-binding protein